MKATTINTYSLNYSELKTYLLVGIFTLGNLLLPQLIHQIPQGGFRFLPILFFTLIASYKYGWRGPNQDLSPCPPRHLWQKRL